MKSSASRIVLLIALSSALAVAQTTGSGGTTGGGSGGTSGGGTAPSRGTGTTTPTGPRRGIPPVQDQEMTRPITLSGRVVMEDGNPPPERVSVERVCNGKARREAYTDSKGYFSFTIDDRQPQMMMQDASVGSEGLDPMSRPSNLGSAMGGGGFGSADPSGSRNLTGCELRAAFAGATSETLQLTGRRAFDDPNVGTIVLRRMMKTGGSIVSMTSLQAPSNAKKSFERGKKALQKGNEAEAKTEFNKAVEVFPAYAEAWAELSDLYMKSQELDKAGDAAEHAVSSDSRFVRPYFTLIVLAAGKEDWTKAAEMSDKLLALDSYNYAAGYYYNALANYRLHRLDKADASVRAARRLDPNNRLPKIGLLMATIMMDRSDFAGAVQEFRTFLDRAPAEGADAQYARNALNIAQNKLASSSQK
jgi:tetratricopeptide (TPR) repeat protein